MRSNYGASSWEPQHDRGDERPIGQASYAVILIDPLTLGRERTLRRFKTGSSYTSKAVHDQAVDWAEAYSAKHPEAATEVALQWHRGGELVEQEMDVWRTCGALASKALDVLDKTGDEAQARAVLAGKPRQ